MDHRTVKKSCNQFWLKLCLNLEKTTFNMISNIDSTYIEYMRSMKRTNVQCKYVQCQQLFVAKLYTYKPKSWDNYSTDSLYILIEYMGNVGECTFQISIHSDLVAYTSFYIQIFFNFFYFFEIFVYILDFLQFDSMESA